MAKLTPAAILAYGGLVSAALGCVWPQVGSAVMLGANLAAIILGRRKT